MNTTLPETDSSMDSKLEDVSNIGTTLSYLLDGGQLANEETILLICGSFFIMSDVREFFGHPVEVDNL